VIIKGKTSSAGLDGRVRRKKNTWSSAKMHEQGMWVYEEAFKI